jgi:hypothetical protein
MLAKASNLNTKGKCRMVVFQDDSPRAPASEITIAPCCKLFFATYQYSKTGISTNSAKNQGWAKLISLK